jgi:16S rRNA (guanine966-N2)-methyltransferase
LPLRIIAGELRGRRLATVPGLKTRPTADRTRESVFNILGPTLGGLHVLDLFAGTGACGLEALSRGAAAACLVEVGREALKVLAANVAALGLGQRAQVVRWDAARNLNCLRDREPKFDLVFMDPPYRQGLVTPALAHLRAAGCLAAGARLVVEHAAEDALPELEGRGFRLTDQRRYGITLVSFLTNVV